VLCTVKCHACVFGTIIISQRICARDIMSQDQHLMPATTPAPSGVNTTGPRTTTRINQGVFDFSTTVKQPHPGLGAEFKTMVYIELQGGLDGAAAMLNVKNADEEDLWCRKRPTLTQEYCECGEWAGGECRRRRAKDTKVSRLSDTESSLAMTDLLASGSDGWLQVVWGYWLSVRAGGSMVGGASSSKGYSLGPRA